MKTRSCAKWTDGPWRTLSALQRHARSQLHSHALRSDLLVPVRRSGCALLWYCRALYGSGFPVAALSGALLRYPSGAMEKPSRMRGLIQDARAHSQCSS